MMLLALYNFCTIEYGTFNCPPGLQPPARLSNYQCTFTKLQGVSNFDCFDRSVYSHYPTALLLAQEVYFDNLSVGEA